MTKIMLAGASGLIGGNLVQILSGTGHEVHIMGRRKLPDFPPAILQHVADAGDWPAIVKQQGADIAISCLGTTMKQAGSKDAFRAVDFDLVVAFAQAARDAGARRFIAVSSVGANPDGGNFYLKTKGETERAVSSLGFERVDFLRPGLLRGERGGPSRPGEQIGIMLSPLTDLLMIGVLGRYRSIPAERVARAIATLLGQQPSGHFIHENDAIEALAG
jgi:uncharacterized protein YbjT (DUF2867 family)